MFISGLQTTTGAQRKLQTLIPGRKQRLAFSASVPRLRIHLSYEPSSQSQWYECWSMQSLDTLRPVKHETGLLASWHHVYTLAFWPYQHWSKEVNNSARETGWEPMKHQHLPHSPCPCICPHIQPSVCSLLHVTARHPLSARCHQHLCILSLGLVFFLIKASTVSFQFIQSCCVLTGEGTEQQSLSYSNKISI